MVVGFTVAVSSTGNPAMVVVFRKFSASTAVAHRWSDVVAVTIIVAVVLVVVVVVVVNWIAAVMMIMIPRVNVGQMMVGVVPAPSIVETIIIPIGRIVVGTVIIARPPPIVTHVNA